MQACGKCFPRFDRPATLTELILFYLDTRSTVDQPMPPWLFLFGILYTEQGFEVYAHYPRYEGGIWGATSLPLKAFTVFEGVDDQQERLRALAVVLRMQSHDLFLLRQLKKRDGHNRVLAWLTA